MTTLLLLDWNWSLIGIKALQFILSFSILVTLHELGHFVAARVFGCRVDKFYLFFNPGFSLFKKKIGDTVYGIGWLPLGGYVSIAGMIDETQGKDKLATQPQPWEFRSKPAWQRLIIMLGGIIVNVLLAVFIYSMMLWTWGEEYIPTSKMQYGVVTDSLSQSVGFVDGDKIVHIDGATVEKSNKISLDIVLRAAKTVQVERNGALKTIELPADFAQKAIEEKNLSFLSVRLPIVPVKTLVDTMPAAKAGVLVGDKIVAADSVELQYAHELSQYLHKNVGKNVILTLQRGDSTTKLSLLVPENGKIGVVFDQEPILSSMSEKVSYSFFAAMGAGVKKTVETLQSYWLQLKLIIYGKVKAKDAVGGLISIGNIFPATWDWQAFWGLTAFLSIVLAIMNLLPIPALDGGHALFCIIEMITGRKPSEKFLEYAQTIGMILLFALMAYALGNDFLKIFRGEM